MLLTKYDFKAGLDWRADDGIEVSVFGRQFYPGGVLIGRPDESDGIRYRYWSSLPLRGIVPIRATGPHAKGIPSEWYDSSNKVLFCA